MTRLFLCLFLLPALALGQHRFEALEPYDFELVLRKKQDGFLLDLRDVDAYIKGHIRKATVVDFLRDDFKEYFTQKYPKTAALYLYAQSEAGSAHCAKYLQELGYENITYLKGGFENWIRKSRPYVSVETTFKPLSYISKENYSQLTRSKPWVLVLFHEDHCPPCEKVDWLELQKTYPELQISKINFSNQKELAENLNIVKNPSLLLYKNGVQVWRETEHINAVKIKENIY
jgi:rhodanese-related sulfurtransferase